MESNNKGCVVEHHTQSKLWSMSYIWTIGNFSMYNKCKKDACIESPTFSVDGNDIKWRLVVYPKLDSEYLSICLHLESDLEPWDKSKVLGQYMLSYLNADSEKVNDTYFYISHLQLHESVGDTKYVSKSTLFNNRHVYLREDKLKILCEINFIVDRALICGNVTDKIIVPGSKISDDFGKLLVSRKFSDITLVVGEHEFPAHKAILAARSEVFAAMFQNDTAELKTGRVNITDLSYEVIQEMLNFIYTEEAPNLKSMANHLLTAADKYGLEKLKAISEQVLLEQLSKETAIETLILADLHSAGQLKKRTIYFIKTNANNILKTEAWQNMITSNAHSSLIADMLVTIMLN